jgi:hypothetical protein
VLTELFQLIKNTNLDLSAPSGNVNQSLGSGSVLILSCQSF